MIIQHNIPALNSYNKLTFNNNNLSKNLEKLSSGYRINRAADDASGLAISEKMRAQITGLDAAGEKQPGRHLPHPNRRGRDERDAQHAQPPVGYRYPFGQRHLHR